MQPDPYRFPEWDLARPIPKRHLDFVLEETACLAVKASWESKDVCVDSWGLEPKTDWGREVGAGQGILRVQRWSMLHEGQGWWYLQSENHELQQPLHSRFLF